MTDNDCPICGNSDCAEEIDLPNGCPALMCKCCGYIELL